LTLSNRNQQLRTMRVEKETSKRLAETANVINNINGGSIFPTFYATTEKDHY